MRPFVTLISDWKLRDPYVAMLKSNLLTAIPESQILDITHSVEFFNLGETAFLMKQCYASFPKGTIHLLLTTFPQAPDCNPVMVEHNGHFFIAEDTGIFYLMFGMETELQGRQFHSSTDTLKPLDKMILLSKSLVDGDFENITEPYTNFKRLLCSEPMHFKSEHKIEGKIVYFDSFFNAVTNIPTEMFKEAVQNHPFCATVQSQSSWDISKYYESYQKDEDMYLVSNSLGCIEIAMYNGNVSVLTDMRIDDKVIITYQL